MMSLSLTQISSLKLLQDCFVVNHGNTFQLGSISMGQALTRGISLSSWRQKRWGHKDWRTTIRFLTRFISLYLMYLLPNIMRETILLINRMTFRMLLACIGCKKNISFWISSKLWLLKQYWTLLKQNNHQQTLIHVLIPNRSRMLWQVQNVQLMKHS